MSGDTCSASSCAPGYTGSPLGTITCSNGQVSGSFAGCTLPASCSATTPQGYIANCGTIASGATCTAQSCASGYVGSPSGSLSCSNGQVSGAFAGCSLPASCSATVPAAYIANCGTTIASGDTCIPQSCASGYVGSPTGAMSCSNGQVSGAFTGCTLPVSCSATVPAAYVTNCGTTIASSDTCISRSCTPGFVGNPTGSLSCSNGQVSGAFAGCALPASCSATVPTAYIANCGTTIASGDTCIPRSCATGYVGNPSGSLSCSDGQVSGAFTGCSLPVSCSATTPQGYVAFCRTIASGATCTPQSCAAN